jgi:hypothetical protein
MTRKFFGRALSLGLVITLLSPVAPAQASSEWPTWTPDTNATTTFSGTGLTNTSVLEFSMSNAGQTAVDFIELRMLGFGLAMQTVMKSTTPLGGSAQSPRSGSKLSIGSGSTVEIEVWMSTGQIKELEIYSESYGFYLDDGSGGSFTGDFHIRIRANQLTSAGATPTIRFEGMTISGSNIFSSVYRSAQTWSSAGTGTQSETTPTPAKYSGPEFSGLSAKGIMVGTSSRLEGKNLDEISSIEIGGKAATFTLDGDKALDLTLPSGLAPGLYDLVINSSAGKLTHINAIQVREPRRAFSVTTRSEGRISEDQYREHTIISAMQIPELNKARCIVNGSNLALAKAQAERLCALVAAANPNIETTVVEPRSTVKNDSVFARVTFGWN